MCHYFYTNIQKKRKAIEKKTASARAEFCDTFFYAVLILCYDHIIKSSPLRAIADIKQNPRFLHHLRSVRSYSLLESPVIICIQPISHPMSGVMVISAKKNQNQTRQDPFAQSYHDRWFFFHNLELEQAFFYAKNSLSRITTYLSHIIAKKNFIIFFFQTLESIHYSPRDRFYD